MTVFTADPGNPRIPERVLMCLATECIFDLRKGVNQKKRG
jgi:hypothetical protein